MPRLRSGLSLLFAVLGEGAAHDGLEAFGDQHDVVEDTVDFYGYTIQFVGVADFQIGGRRLAGAFTEDDLEKDQSFNNYYEETKFLAEAAVQRRMREGFPATIYRPSIVVGDSRRAMAPRVSPLRTL